MELNSSETHILIQPLNIIYWLNKTYMNSHQSIYDMIREIKTDFTDRDISVIANDENLMTFLKTKIELVPYVLDGFIKPMFELGIKVKLYIKQANEYEILDYLIDLLQLNDYFGKEDIIMFDQIQKCSDTRKIVVSDSIEDLIFFRSLNFLTIFNFLIFNDTTEYLSLQYKNLDLLKTHQKIYKPNLTIESLRQSNEFISHIHLNKDIEDFFKNSIKVLYIFDSKSNAKNYRKRELALSTSKITYIPFITKNFGLDDSLSIYDDQIQVILQRCPYLYFDKTEYCKELNSIFLNYKNSIMMHSMSVIDGLFKRLNVYDSMMFFASQIGDRMKSQYNINIKVPFSFKFSLEDYSHLTCENIKILLKQVLIQHASNIDYPFIIKPDSCTEHYMYLILSEEGLDNFINKENYLQIMKMKTFICQKFIPHGGTMFKNYYINNKTFTITRPSIPDLEGDILNSKQLENKCFTFHNEFLYKKEDPTFWENSVISSHESEINYKALDEISQLFVDIMDITFFGLDYLFEKETNTYFLLEVNYFPSYRELGTSLPEEFADHIIDYYNKKKIFTN